MVTDWHLFSIKILTGSITPQLHAKLQNNHYVELNLHYGDDLGLLSAIKHSISGACGVIS